MLSTTFHHPYHLARLLASIDHLSAGRACWNVVTFTTDFEARDFGMKDLPAKEDRYARGDEIVEACCALWDCWEEGAMVMDKEEGLFIDPGKVRYANYKGEHVSTRGPLTIPRSPQGRPVLMQAGSSPRGREFAALWGEAIFASATDVRRASSWSISVAGTATCGICRTGIFRPDGEGASLRRTGMRQNVWSGLCFGSILY